MKIEELQKAVELGYNKAMQELPDKIAIAVDKLTQETVLECIGKYSDSGKEIVKSIKEGLQLDFTNIDMVQYSQIITKAYEKQLEKGVFEALQKGIEENIKNIAGLLPKNEYKLSEVIDLLAKEYMDDEDVEGVEFEVKIETSGFTYTKINSQFIYIKKDYKTIARIHIWDGEVSSVNTPDLDEKDKYLSQKETSFLLMKMAFQRVKLVIDDYKTEYYKEEEY